jgi:hypothetical protein
VRDISEQEVYSNYVSTLNTWSLAQKHMNLLNLKDSDLGKKEDKDEISPDSLVSSYLTDNYFNWRAKYH